MDTFYHNTHTITDSDNDSIIIIENRRTNVVSHVGDHPMSPEEPDFFSQVIQRQRKRKKPEIRHEESLVQKDVYTIDHQSTRVLIIDDPIRVDAHTIDCQNTHIFVNDAPFSNICEPEKQQNIELHNGNISETDMYTAVDTEKTSEVVMPKRKKRLTKEEMEEKKREEKTRKDAKKKLVEKLKRLNPKECMKYITVHIDINLQNQDYGGQILSEIQSTDAKYKIESNSVIPNSVTWSRQISDNVSEDENVMLLIWDFEYVTNIIISNQLLEKINHLKLFKSQLSLIIYSTAEQLKKTKTKKNGSRSDMLNSLEQMMLSCHVSFRFIDNKNDIGLAICYFTKSIAQKPYKLNKYKEEQEGCDWYASGLTKNCVSIDKNGTGLTQLWRQMLSQFPLCALETSEAIASAYDSPIALLEAYDKCSSRLEGETLLQDIPVRRGFGPLASNRRIGPELSKKIYMFFTDNTGCTTLSQE